MKRAMISIILISMLLASSTTVFVHARTEPKDEVEPTVGDVHVDASSVLREMGYTDENISTASTGMLVQLLRSYDVTPTILPDGSYQVTITSNSSTIEPTAPAELQDIAPAIESEMGTTGTSLDSLEGKACLVVAIWDYPGTGLDIPPGEDKYDQIDYWISNYAEYDYRKDLVNSDATWYYIWAWLTWECASYGSIDVYWSGHGTHISWQWPWIQITAFISYDAWDDSSGVNPGNCYVAYDFETDGIHGEYDYSTLRTGIGSFCYGWGFHDMFLDPGGSETHYRAFAGPDGTSDTGYGTVYLQYWGYWWYLASYSTYESYCYADEEAWEQYSGNTRYSYDETGSIWF